MPLVKDLIGKKFGKLTVIERDFNNDKMGTWWICKCDCNNYHSVETRPLNAGKTKSCGCIVKTQNGLFAKNKRLSNIWQLMKYRCDNCKYKDYKNYGGRGIKVCVEWYEYKNFYKWALENGYKDDLTIERIDVNGNYCPENCDWILKREQANNKTTTHNLVAFGETKSIKDWLEDSRCLVTRSCLEGRIKLGWENEDAITTKSTKENFRDRLVCIKIARQIRKLATKNVPKKDIAEIYCITIPCINDILANRTWKEPLE